ncbi:MAG: class I tRNA ligase family protein [Verrucomicrobiales bacterium]
MVRDARLAGDLVKCGDTLDVWIDSGCSSMAVTERHPDLGAGGIADLYIEATDQHRGWFQSSLMCSIIHRDRAPYKAVMTHGFVTDTNGEKLSKAVTNRSMRSTTSANSGRTLSGSGSAAWTGKMMSRFPTNCSNRMRKPTAA